MKPAPSMVRIAILVASLMIVALLTLAAILSDRRCDAVGANCGDKVVGAVATVEVVAERESEAANDDSSNVDRNTSGVVALQVREELEVVRIGVLLAFFLSAVLSIVATIKWVRDGTLLARLAIWGLLPEAYAVISLRAAVGLLRLKSRPTPVVFLENCVTDAGAAELADAIHRYRRTACVQVLELPQNPALTGIGLQSFTAMALLEESTLEEIDISYNPHLGDHAMVHILPLFQAKSCKINTLRIAGCGISTNFLQNFAEGAARSKLRMLDLAYNDLRGSGDVLSEICEAPVLEELMLACCSLSPSDIKTLAEQLPYTSIKSLHLGGNRFGNDGLFALTEHLPTSQIDDLGLEWNDIEVPALSALGTAWAKRPFSRARLDGNKMSQADVVNFVWTLRSMDT